MEPIFELSSTVVLKDMNKCCKSDLHLEVTDVEGVQMAKISAFDPQFRKWISNKVRHAAALSAIILSIEEEIVKKSLLQIGSSYDEVRKLSRWFLKRFLDKSESVIAGLESKLITIDLDGEPFKAVVQTFARGHIQIQCVPELFSFMVKQHQHAINVCDFSPESDAKKHKANLNDDAGASVADHVAADPHHDSEPQGLEAEPNGLEAEAGGLEDEPDVLEDEPEGDECDSPFVDTE